MRLRVWFAAGLAGLGGLAGLYAGCAGRGRAPHAVILITLDTTRADRIGCYFTPESDPTKPAHVETPNLDRLAADGLLFLNAVTPVPLTCPAHTTMMTGLYPQSHGVTSNETTRAGDDLPLLSVDFKKAGYATAAFISGFVLNSSCGLARGFDHYADLTEESRRAAETTDAVLQWLDSAPVRERLFLWVHYYDPHTPYAPPADIRGFEDFPYDGEIAYMDREIGRLLDGLRQRRLDQNAVLAIVGDHGEGLEDHGESEHGVFLYEETQRVPWIVRLPARTMRNLRRADRRIPEVVSLADLRPTLAGLAGIKMLGEAPQGRDLRPLMMADGGRDGSAGSEATGGQVVLLETLYPEECLGWSRLQGLRGDRWKYIQAPTPELYDRQSDPREKNNLAGSLPDTLRRYARLHEVLRQETTRARESAKKTTVDPETERMLRSLGYLAPSAAPAAGRDLPDPKAMIGLFRLLEQSKTHAERGEWAEALEPSRRVLEEDPDNPIALSYQAVSLARLGRREESNAVLEVILRNRPEDGAARFTLGENLISLDRRDEAIPHLDRALGDARFRSRAHLLLAAAFDARDDFAAAYEHASAALADARLHDRALRHMGLLSIQLGQMDRAVQEITPALRAFPNDAELHMRLGVALLASPGREAEAERELRRAVELAPAQPMYHYNLACSLARQGRNTDAIEQLRQAVALGYADIRQLRTDQDLASVRQSPEMDQLLTRLAGKNGQPSR